MALTMSALNVRLIVVVTENISRRSIWCQPTSTRFFSALSFSLLADIHWQIAIMHSSRALTDEIMSLCRSARVVCCRRRMRTASGQTLTTFPENLEMSWNLTDVRGIKILSGQLLLASCLGPRQCAVYFCLVGCFGFISPFWKYFLFVKSILNILQ